MKEGIHPNYIQTQVECACGSTFVTRSTIPRIRLELCSQCHPFYTGRQRLVDRAGRVERFTKKYAHTEGKTVVRKATKKVSTPQPSETKKVAKILRNVPRVTAPEKGRREPGAGRGPRPPAKGPKPAEAKPAGK